MNKVKNKRIMVDMSATLIHHGHIRLLKSAKEFGDVIVALTTDDEIKNKKGYMPELNYSQRKEILEAIRYVDEVVPSEWLLTELFLQKHCIDWLVHGSDNFNNISRKKLKILPRTEGISSSMIRKKAKDICNLSI
jgi:glycerol-3-phosphate cytidylyltransferase